METDRRIILHLVAMGRITPAEAERLLIAGNDGREARWVLAAALGFAFLAEPQFRELLPGVANAVHAALGSSPDLPQPLLPFFTPF